ncbi:MAG: crossover junction endodeoxyribonuclease RuvC [Planctomycetota bacterium]|nr:crossover junction endodeoxyribonuclease RuvC [Planctomycetota bacterium]
MAKERVLGIDPGTQVVGWGVVESGAHGPIYVASGVWKLGDSRRSVPERLARLRKELVLVLDAWNPTRVAVESAFFGNNARSALRIGEARGVVLCSAGERGIPLVELAPAMVKKRVAGSGAARKEQVARLLTAQLSCPVFATEDESDAIAVALCAYLDGDTPSFRGKIPPGARIQ